MATYLNLQFQSLTKNGGQSSNRLYFYYIFQFLNNLIDFEVFLFICRLAYSFLMDGKYVVEALGRVKKYEPNNNTFKIH